MYVTKQSTPLQKWLTTNESEGSCENQAAKVRKALHSDFVKLNFCLSKEKLTVVHMGEVSYALQRS